MFNQLLSCLTLLAFVSFSQVAGADNIYKCKNAKGVLIYGSAPCADHLETLNTWTVTAKARPPSILTLKQNESGHYLLDGMVNEQAVTFIVDTGASFVSLPPAIAQAAQIKCENQVTVHTANGATQACKVTIPQFKFGAFVLHDVAAIIAPNLSQPLLGMNVLQQYKIAQEHGEMHISDRH